MISFERLDRRFPVAAFTFVFLLTIGLWTTGMAFGQGFGMVPGIGPTAPSFSAPSFPSTPSFRSPSTNAFWNNHQSNMRAMDNMHRDLNTQTSRYFNSHQQQMQNWRRNNTALQDSIRRQQMSVTRPNAITTYRSPNTDSYRRPSNTRRGLGLLQRIRLRRAGVLTR